MKTPTKDYAQDATGQWWYTNPQRGNRFRVPVRTCQQCRLQFVQRHPQKFCSAHCRVESTRGVLRVERVPRVCGWCKAEFIPRKPSLPRRFCSRKCGHAFGNTVRGRKGALNPRWKGGTRRGPVGYIREWVPERGYLLQHRVVMERMLGANTLTNGTDSSQERYPRRQPTRKSRTMDQATATRPANQRSAALQDVHLL